VNLNTQQFDDDQIIEHLISLLNVNEYETEPSEKANIKQNFSY
jgi:hypothetical protein